MSHAICPICGSPELRSDEVYDLGLVLLTECPRCQHRSVEHVSAAPRTASRSESLAA